MNEIISIQNICLDLNAKDRNDVLKYISELANELDIISNKNEVFKSLIEREEQQSTYLGEYISLPHTKSEYVRVPKIFIIKLKNIIMWDNFEVKLVISILAPEYFESKKHLSIISGLTRKLVNKEFRKELIEAEKKEQVLEMIYSAI